MREESASSGSRSKFEASRLAPRNRNASKLSMYETNMENFSRNQKFNLEKIDPKGVQSVGIFGSFSGVIEDLHLFSNCDHTLQVSYRVFMGQEWHDETPEIDDTEGESHFCESREGKVTFSLGFDFLASCMFVASWPQIVFTVRGFNGWGELVTLGYAQAGLPSETGQFLLRAHLYSIVRNERWYHRWLPFLRAEPSTLEDSEIERVIVRGEGRETEKVKSLGVLNVRVETLLRNFSRFGYR